MSPGHRAHRAVHEVAHHVHRVRPAARGGERLVDAGLVGDVARLHADVEQHDPGDEPRRLPGDGLKAKLIGGRVVVAMQVGDAGTKVDHSLSQKAWIVPGLRACRLRS